MKLIKHNEIILPSSKKLRLKDLFDNNKQLK
jgi:hypothetical protein